LKIWSVLLISSLLFTGCGIFKTKTETVIETKYVSRSIPVKEHPKPLSMHPVTFQVVSYKNLKEFLADNKERYGVAVFMALDVSDYENLSLNMAELIRYVEQQQAIILYYEEQAPEPVIEDIE